MGRAAGRPVHLVAGSLANLHLKLSIHNVNLDVHLLGVKGGVAIGNGAYEEHEGLA